MVLRHHLARLQRQLALRPQQKQVLLVARRLPLLVPLRPRLHPTVLAPRPRPLLSKRMERMLRAKRALLRRLVVR